MTGKRIIYVLPLQLHHSSEMLLGQKTKFLTMDGLVCFSELAVN